MDIITIAGIQYHTTREKIKEICLNCGFDSVTFRTENIKGKFRKGHYFPIIKHSFRCARDKMIAGRRVKEELNNLEVI